MDIKDIERVSVEEFPRDEIIQGIVVVNDPWYMDLLHNFKLYFFNPKKRKEPKPLYLFFYETKKEQYGKKNENPGQIRYMGHVKEVIYNVELEDFPKIDVLKPLTEDPYYWNHILNRGEKTRHIIRLEKIEELKKPLTLRNNIRNNTRINAKNLNGIRVALHKLPDAEFIEDILELKNN